jgi:hypothetical protein
LVSLTCIQNILPPNKNIETEYPTTTRIQHKTRTTPHYRLNKFYTYTRTQQCVRSTYPICVPTYLQKITIVIQSILENQNTQEYVIKQIKNIMHTVLSQNYFRFNKQYYKQAEGLAMGVPSSALLAKIILEYLEHNNIHNILIKHKILSYFRYADDILILHNKKLTNIDLTLLDFNKIWLNLRFTMEKEQNEKINFLDITIQWTGNNL